MPLQRWFHVAFSHRPGLLSVYVDGVEVFRDETASVLGPLLHINAPLYASSPASFGQPTLDADMSDLRHWPSVAAPSVIETQASDPTDGE